MFPWCHDGVDFRCRRVQKRGRVYFPCNWLYFNTAQFSLDAYEWNATDTNCASPFTKITKQKKPAQSKFKPSNVSTSSWLHQYIIYGAKRTKYCWYSRKVRDTLMSSEKIVTCKDLSTVFLSACCLIFGSFFLPVANFASLKRERHNKNTRSL